MSTTAPATARTAPEHLTAPAGLAPLDVTVNGKRRQTMTLTSEYAWLYGMYPFSNDPDVDPNPEPDPVPKPFRPNHFYDEQRLLLGKTYQAGDVVRLAVPEGATADTTTVDLLDYELVDKPGHKPHRAVSVVRFGADAHGVRDSSDAFDRAIAYARRAGVEVWIPAGRFKITRHIVVNEVTVRGSGNWHTVVFGPVTRRSSPAEDGSVHDAPGFYESMPRTAAAPASTSPTSRSRAR